MKTLGIKARNVHSKEFDNKHYINGSQVVRVWSRCCYRDNQRLDICLWMWAKLFLYREESNSVLREKTHNILCLYGKLLCLGNHLL